MKKTALAVLGLSLIAGTAHAQQTTVREDTSIVGSSYAVDPMFVSSSEIATFDLRAGVYTPNLGGSAFANNVGGDLGPSLGGELDVYIWRIPYIGPIAVGGSFAWTEWSGSVHAADGTTVPNAPATGMSLINFNALLVLRVDALARYLRVPLILTGKVGPDFGYWQIGSEGETDGEGWSIGLRWAAQLALELDWLDERAARRLDEEWGINHSHVFFELFGSTMGQWSDRQLPVGTDLAWVAGLGIVF